MIVAMKSDATESEIEGVCEHVRALGYRPHQIKGEERTVVAVVGKAQGVDHTSEFINYPGVENVMAIQQPFKLVSRQVKSSKTIVRIGDIAIGGDELIVMAGPCSVESREQILETARAVKQSGARILRGGAFKPRTSPYDFQGLEQEGLKLLAEARRETGLPIITEVMSAEDVEMIAEYADILQVGARNMQNFTLLKKLGRAGRPVLLKRGMSSTIKEFLMSAEYIVAHGNPDVILCERGIRTFETATRNTLDLAVVPVLNELTHLPVVIDPSHATGKRSLVAPLAKAAAAIGADGLIVEVHPTPDQALSDGAQSLDLPMFEAMMQQVRRYAAIEGRYVA
ncbi:MAG TPA: 3-deoxy-7-phosphoheptulonate synthase [Blastocatellia bacterium]|nr:3-deoxy-7-phosphoheptulonate synthase [Blastocatellia bacterium]